MKSIAKVQSEDREKNQIQENIRQAVQPVLNNPLVNGAFLKNQTLSSGTNVIPHGLGRLQQGWIITDINASVGPYRSAPFDSSNLTLTASGSATCTLYVF